MNCSKCGRELPNGSTICAFCGNKTEVKSFFYSVKDDSPAEENVTGRPYDNEPVRPATPAYGTYPASSAAPVASKGIGAGTIILIIATVVLSLLAGIFALKYLVKDPIVDTWTVTKVEDSGMTYTPEDVFGSIFKITFNKDKTLHLENPALSELVNDDNISGTWEKVEKGKYSVSFYNEYYGNDTEPFYLEGKILTWEINNGAVKVVFEK